VVAWQSGSHRRLKRAGWNNYTFAFHDNEELGPALLAQIAKKTGLRREDL
jgi:predicted RNA binding protein YcfA (HicA-like mRNA interferase family)